jgi:antirestriction protein ArdC
MAAALLSGEAGIRPNVIENQAAYFGEYSYHIKQDKKLVVTATSVAQRAADWIRGKSQPAT